MASSRNRSNHPITSLDLWAEILKRLPAGKSLCRLRCVCKSWNSLISSSWFITHHHSFTADRRRRSHNNNTYFLHIDDPPRSSYSLYSTTPGGSDTHHSLLPPEVCRLPFEPIRGGTGTCRFDRYDHVIAVSHGLVCLFGAGPTILWNPTIGKYIEIDPTDHPRQPIVGFGFDRRNDDFKVVRRISGCDDPRGSPIFEVSSTRRRGPWRRPMKSNSCTVNGRPFFLGFDRRGVSKGGNIYWLIERCIAQGCNISYASIDSKGRPCETALLVFDCEREEFETRDLPREITEHDNWYCSRLWLFVSNTSGMLSILRLTRSMKEGEELEEWVMDDDDCGLWTMRTMRDVRDVVTIRETIVVRHSVTPPISFLASVPTPFEDGLSKKRSSAPHLFNGFVFEPSLYLMDANTHVLPSPSPYI